MTTYQYLIDYYRELPFLIKLIGALITLSVILIIGLTIYLKGIRRYQRKKHADILKFKSEYEVMLVEFLYADDHIENEVEKNSFNEWLEQIEVEPAIQDELDDTIKDLSPIQQSIISKLRKEALVKSKRKIIISILYKLMEEVSGEMSDSIKVLYIETGLIDYALKKINNTEWSIKAKSIGELSRFEVKEGHYEVVKCMDHSNKEVRKEAHLYMVNLFQFDGLYFLNELKTPLSEWDQIQILEILQRFDDQQICDIRPWLKSTNDTVVLFGLKLAQIYNQYEINDTLIELLSHKSKSIRVCVIEVLTHLYGLEAKDMLKANFNELSLEEQLSFFTMLEKLVIPSDEPFIEKHLFHKDFEIQLLALKILKSINEDKYKVLNNLPADQKSKAMLQLENTI